MTNTHDPYPYAPAGSPIPTPHRVLEETTLRETGTLLSRFPPIFGKIARRKQLLVSFFRHFCSPR